MTELAIRLSDVVFSYPNAPAQFICTEWQMTAGDRVFLHGASGSGKSTFLSLLAGISTPQTGEINILNTSLESLSLKQRDRFRAKNIGIVFQQFNLIPYLSVLQNVQLAVYFADAKVAVSDKLPDMMALLRLDESILHRPVAELSVGQKQRVAIMRAFINSPKLMLVDEPTSALDANARDGFMSMLLSLCDANQTSLLFVSHDEMLRQHFKQHTAITDICSWQPVSNAKQQEA